jgi:hypothetical protein
MDLENYTNINIFKKVFENKEVMSSKNMIEQPHHIRKEAAEGGNKQHAGGFNPYVNNQGTTVGKQSKGLRLTKFYSCRWKGLLHSRC